MKMDRMVEYLENRGFKAEKEYNKFDKAYVFTVTKNGLSVMDSFAYPASADYSVVDKAQRKFLDHMIDYWKRTANSVYGSKPSKSIEWEVRNIDWKLDSNGDRYDAEITAYIVNDIKTVHKSFHDYLVAKLNGFDDPLPRIDNVIFNDPATIVFWSDGTKTVVKCQEGDTFDSEKGLAMAISKKALGNQGNFNEVFKKWCVEPEEYKPMSYEQVMKAIHKFNELFK